MYPGAGRQPGGQDVDPNDLTHPYNQPIYYDDVEDMSNYMDYDEVPAPGDDYDDGLALDIPPPGEQMRIQHFHNVFNTSTVMSAGPGSGPHPPSQQTPQQQQQQQRHQSQPMLQPDYTYTYHQTHLAPDASRRLRTRHREDRLSALSVLLDRELLMLQALGTNETLPQARRRFMSKLMAPEDPSDAASIRADRYNVFIRSNAASGSHVAVPRSVVDVHETGDEGWGQGQGHGKIQSPGQDKSAASPSPLGVSKRGSRMAGQQSSSGGRVVSGSPSQASRRRSGAAR